jgi:fatty-acyl-CoA synthase
MLELVHAEQASVLFAAPTTFIAMLREPEFAAGRFDTSRLRIATTGATPIPVPLMEQVKAQLGPEPVIGFGMTVASPMVTGTLPDDSFELRSATVGVPLPDTEVKIVDRSGVPVRLGEPGELCIRGYLVMQGY